MVIFFEYVYNNDADIAASSIQEGSVPMKRNFYITVFILLTIPRTVQDQGTISGSVVDRQTGAPLIGATIFLKGSNYGTICDFG